LADFEIKEDCDERDAEPEHIGSGTCIRRSSGNLFRAYTGGVFEQSPFDLVTILGVLFLTNDAIAPVSLELRKLIAIHKDVCLTTFVIGLSISFQKRLL
jgi:hypothetical protein